MLADLLLCPLAANCIFTSRHSNAAVAIILNGWPKEEMLYSHTNKTSSWWRSFYKCIKQCKTHSCWSFSRKKEYLLRFSKCDGSIYTLACSASAVILEEENSIEPQKSHGRKVGRKGSLKDIHSKLLLDAGLSPALDQVSHCFFYPKSGMEILQPPWAAFASFSSSFQWKKLTSFTNWNLPSHSLWRLPLAMLSVTIKKSLALSSV